MNKILITIFLILFVGCVREDLNKDNEQEFIVHEKIITANVKRIYGSKYSCKNVSENQYRQINLGDYVKVCGNGLYIFKDNIWIKINE